MKRALTACAIALNTLLVMSLTTWIASCGGDDDTSGTLGGAEDVVVFVPEGAHRETITPTVTELDASAFPRQQDLVSAVYEIGPDGTEFDSPVTVGIPLGSDVPVGAKIEVVRFDAASEQWEVLPGTTIVGNIAYAQTDHFTPFAAAQNPTAPGCQNVWSGGPGTVAPLLAPGGITVTPGTKTGEDLANSGPSQIALGSTWTTDACDVTVTGDFGSGLSGDGAWIDFQEGTTGMITQGAGGSFSLQLPVPAPAGPYFGLSDPCHAPYGNYPYSLTINSTVDCVDRCAGVSCSNAGNTNPCTQIACNPQNGLCDPAPTAGSCGSNSGGKCVEGLCMVEVNNAQGETGVTACQAEGLTCDDSPALMDPPAACLAFNPSATVSMDANGWRQAVYCDNNTGKACEGRANECHHCPACNVAPGFCTLGDGGQLERIYVSCI